MQAQLKSLLKTAKKYIDEATDESTLQKIHINYLGKKGEVTQLLKLLAKLFPEERPQFGKSINEVKYEIQTLLTKKSAQLRRKALHKKLTQEKIDVTLRDRYARPWYDPPHCSSF